MQRIRLACHLAAVPLQTQAAVILQDAETVPPRQRFENMIHLQNGNDGGGDARDGRDEQVAVQLCRSGRAHSAATPAAQDQTGGQ